MRTDPFIELQTWCTSLFRDRKGTRVKIRIASAIFVLLILTVAIGWCALPETTNYPAPANAVYVRTATPGPGDATCALIFGFLISGAAAIGLAFFAPQTPKGSRWCGTLSAVAMVATDFAERLDSLYELLVDAAGGGLAHLHEEFEVVLGLLQTVEQQIDRLVRVQAGQYAAQFVQYRRLVGVEQ